MEEETDPSPEYIRAFNNGYLIAKHEPNLAAQLAAQANEQNEYFNALRNGGQQYEKEVQEWTKSFSRGTPEKEGRETDRDR